MTTGKSIGGIWLAWVQSVGGGGAASGFQDEDMIRGGNRQPQWSKGKGDTCAAQTMVMHVWKIRNQRQTNEARYSISLGTLLIPRG